MVALNNFLWGGIGKHIRDAGGTRPYHALGRAVIAARCPCPSQVVDFPHIRAGNFQNALVKRRRELMLR
jgi:hypothetical protein